MDTKNKQLLDLFNGICSDPRVPEFLANDPEEIFGGYGIQLSEKEVESIRIAQEEARLLWEDTDISFSIPALTEVKYH
ncbi:MAG: hypothetical protein GY940_44495 [bacterium]|nr:hypothetical protein [bacterium]